MKIKYVILTCLIIILSLGLTSCGKKAKKIKAEPKPVPVTVMQAQIQEFKVRLRSVGNLYSRTVPQIRSQVQGIVKKVDVFEGQIVKKGQLLLEISREQVASQLYQSESALLRAKAQVAQTKDIYDSYSKLYKEKNIARIQYEQSKMNYESAQAEYNSAKYANENAYYNYRQANIYAPIDGQILAVEVSVGQTVMPGDKLIQLISHNELEAHFPFSEDKLHYLRIGQLVTVHSVTHPNETLQAKISAISPAINPNNLGLNITLRFINNKGWRSGASVVGELYASNNRKAVMIPEESVLLRPEGYIAFVVNNKSQAIERILQTGTTSGGMVEVISGINPGEWVVVNGANYLANGSLVQVVGES